MTDFQMSGFPTSGCRISRQPDVKIFDTNNKEIRIRENNMKISKKNETQTGHVTTLHPSIWFDYESTSLFPMQDQQKADRLPVISF